MICFDSLFSYLTFQEIEHFVADAKSKKRRWVDEVEWADETDPFERVGLRVSELALVTL